jgi:uncharacterized membrane-anchored protein YhcB (DUF1043 family)
VESMNKTTMVSLGLLIGAFIGFLVRPTAPLIGQLPFGVVMTRGANLRGLDQILVPLAQRSFNYVLVGAILGVIGGFVIGRLGPSKR